MGTNARYCISLDDDPMIPMIVEAILKMRVLPFVSARKLLGRAASYDPVAVFVDIHLENGESGLQVLAELRQIWPFRPIIVITADQNPAFIGQALSLGANDFVRKPLTEDELRARTQSRILELQGREDRGALACGDVAFYKGLQLMKGPKGERYLSASEARLLEPLLSSPGLVLPKRELKGMVWGDLKVSDNALDRKLFLLRGGLKDVSDSVRLVSKYGRGVAVEINTNEV